MVNRDDIYLDGLLHLSQLLLNCFKGRQGVDNPFLVIVQFLGICGSVPIYPLLKNHFRVKEINKIRIKETIFFEVAFKRLWIRSTTGLGLGKISFLGRGCWDFRWKGRVQER